MRGSIFGILSVFVFFYFPIVAAAERREWLGRDDIPKDAADYLNNLGSKRKIGRIIYLLDKLEQELAWKHMDPPFEQMRKEGRESCNSAAHFAAAVRNKDVHVITVTRCGNLKDQNLASAIAALNELLQPKVASEEKFYIIAFSEAFFNELCGSENRPLSNEQVTAIVEGLKGLSSKDNVILSLCFWHQFTKETRLEWLPEWEIPAHFRDGKKEGRSPSEVYVKSDKQLAKSMVATLFKGYDIPHIACYNVFIWKQSPQCVYRKSTFYDEVTPLEKNCDCECCGFGFPGSRYSCRTAVDQSVLGSWSWRNGCEMSKPASSLVSSRPSGRRSRSARRARPGFLYEFGDFNVHMCNGADEDFVDALFDGPSAPIVPLICGDLLVLYRELGGHGPEKDPLIAPRVSKANLLLVSAYSARIREDLLKAAMNDEGVALIVDFSIACPLISREGLRYLDRDSSLQEETGIVMWLSTDLRIATSPELADGSVTPPSD